MRQVFLALAVLTSIPAPSLAWADEDLVVKVRQGSTLAVSGYDVVSYHLGAPQKGHMDIQAEHHGVTFRFSSERNRSLFLAEPDRYAPLFDGQCVVSLSNGKDRPGDPEAFTFIDGKLVFVGGRGLVKRVDKNPEKILSRATENWGER